MILTQVLVSLSVSMRGGDVEVADVVPLLSVCCLGQVVALDHELTADVEEHAACKYSVERPLYADDGHIQ